MPNIEADCEKKQAEFKLIAELEKGKRSGNEQGWFSIEEVEKALGIDG
jgi:hypothetical protein